MSNPWVELARRLATRWLSSEAVLLEGDETKFVEELADRLAQYAGHPQVGAKISKWLLRSRLVEDVFIEDDEIRTHVHEAAASLRAESGAGEKADEDAMLTKLKRHFGRAWWRPEVREGDAPELCTKFGGAPWLAEGEAWPTCGNCSKPLAFLAQLLLKGLPPEFEDSPGGFVQLFYCISKRPKCETKENASKPGSTAVLVRWLANGDGGAPTEEQPFPAREVATLVRWDDGGIEMPSLEYQDDATYADEYEKLWDDIESKELMPAAGDKLGGWPGWMQEETDYPACGECEEPMKYMFQLDSNELCQHQFGKMGVGYIFQCHKHPTQVVFTWNEG